MNKPQPTKNPLLQTLIQMTGQQNVITIHRPLVDFLGGSLEAALLLGQLLYWTPRSTMNGWVAKSDADWQGELCISRYGVRNATGYLSERNLIMTELRRFNGAPTNHYMVNWDELEKQWSEWLDKLSRLSEIEQSESANSDNPLSETEQSLTEITSEITSEITNEEEGDPKIQNIFMTYTREIGLLTPIIADALQDAEKTYPAHWIYDAIAEAAKNNARNWKYVEAILKRWHAQGNQEPVKKPERANSNGKHAQTPPVNVSDRNQELAKKLLQRTHHGNR